MRQWGRELHRVSVSGSEGYWGPSWRLASSLLDEAGVDDLKSETNQDSQFERAQFRVIHESESEVAQSCLTLCDPVDCSLPSSSVHGILQARILEWVAISFSRGSSQPRDRTWISCFSKCCATFWQLLASLSLQFPSLTLKQLIAFGYF